MVTVKEKRTIVQRLSATCPTHSRSDVTARDVESVIDEPKERGGTNLGLSPTETLLAALIGCSNVISRKIAHRAGVELAEVSIDLEADFDRRGVMLDAEVDLPWPEIRLDVHVTTSASDQQMERIKAELGTFCPVAKLFRAAGTNIVERWHVTRP